MTTNTLHHVNVEFRPGDSNKDGLPLGCIVFTYITADKAEVLRTSMYPAYFFRRLLRQNIDGRGPKWREDVSWEAPLDDEDLYPGLVVARVEFKPDEDAAYPVAISETELDRTTLERKVTTLRLTLEDAYTLRRLLEQRIDGRGRNWRGTPSPRSHTN